MKQWPEAPKSINYQPVTLQDDQRSASITTKVKLQEKATAPDVATAISNQQEVQQQPQARIFHHSRDKKAAKRPSCCSLIRFSMSPRREVAADVHCERYQ